MALELMKILLVEDSIKTVSYLKKGLEEEGFEVSVALDGESGLMLALGSDFDLIILDVMLPIRDGWSVISELRQSGKSCLTLFLSACDTLDDRIKGLNLGADAYLVKPFAFSELIAQVRTLLRRSPVKANTNVLQVNDLVIDLVNHVATRAGQTLDLTPKEFSLLALLVRRRGEILTRAMISAQVWNIHFDSGSNCVDVHIRRLRAKIDDPWQVKLIKTIRGSGYSVGELS